MTAATRPVLRWHGGKWILAPWIISHFPRHKVYVEPFGGAFSVCLRKPQSYAEVYNDLDGDAVNLFRVLRGPRATELVNLIALTPFARTEFLGSYDDCDDEVERARRLIVRSFMGFGSNGHNRKTGFRANSNRSGTTPARDWANYPDALARVIERLNGVVIEHRDASEVMLAHDGIETLHYVDPPYIMATRSDDGADYAHELTDDDHRKLCDTLSGLEGMVVLSGYPNAIYGEILEGWQCIKRDAYADNSKPRVECLWVNPQAIVHPGLFDEVAA
jgi:DNA adenine methylase